MQVNIDRFDEIIYIIYIHRAGNKAMAFLGTHLECVKPTGDVNVEIPF